MKESFENLQMAKISSNMANIRGENDKMSPKGSIKPLKKQKNYENH